MSTHSNTAPVQLKHLLMFVLLAAIWGASFMFARVSAPEFGPVAFTFIRVGLAGLVLSPIIFMGTNLQILRENFGLITFVSILNSALPFMLLAYATLYLNAGLTSVLNSFVPIFSGVIAHFYLKDHLSRGQSMGLLIGIIGVAVLMMNKLAIGNNTILPLCATLVSSLSYAISANVIKRRLNHVSSRLLAASGMCIAGLTLLPLGLLTWPTQNPSPTAWGAVIAVAILSTALAYLMFFELIRHIGPTRTVSVTLVVPIFGILWGAQLLNEELTINIVAGTIIILLGAYLSLSLKWFSRK